MSSGLFFTTFTNTTVKFLLQRCLEDINTGTNASPRLHFRRVGGNKCRKVLKKTRIFILIARDVFVALSIVVAKVPYIYERDSSILVLPQTRMIKCKKVSRQVGQIVYTTKHCEFTFGGWVGRGGGVQAVQSDVENCTYLWKTPGYAPAYSERKIT